MKPKTAKDPDPEIVEAVVEEEKIGLSLWGAMEKPEVAVLTLCLGSTRNTDSTEDGVFLPIELVGSWGTCTRDPFPDYDRLVQYAKDDGVYDHLKKTKVKKSELGQVLTGRQWANNDEKMLEINLRIHFDIVNLVLENCIKRGKIVTMQGGKSGRAGEEEVNIKSEPDRATVLIPAPVRAENGETIFFDFRNLDSAGSRNYRNLIPGELKMAFKFNYDFIRATKKTQIRGRELEVPDWWKRGQAEQVMTQIYQYMNERSSAIGYLITEKELICVRRPGIERYGCSYGVIDISPPIPLSAPAGQLNAKLALWYLNYRYALKSPKLRVLPMTAKPDNWGGIVRSITNQRNDRPRKTGTLKSVRTEKHKSRVKKRRGAQGGQANLKTKK